jgi:hypothetical protein
MAVWGEADGMKWLLVILTLFALTGCDYDEVKREIGYKGKARINPWLAAERFCGRYGGKVKSLPSWTAPVRGDAVWFVPASLLNNDSFTRRLENWVKDGGHLVILVEHANAETNDWSPYSMEPELVSPVIHMLVRAGIELTPSEKTMKASKIRFSGNSYTVNASSETSVKVRSKKPAVFASTKSGAGRLTVLTDARLFRNRWIGDEEHAALLDALITATNSAGNIGFLRGSGLSLWGLLCDHLWPLLWGLGVLTGLWLWKNFARFGPVEATTGPSVLRGYDHHLEALGDFQWRVDRAAGLLHPLRLQIIERGQRISMRAGHRDDDFFQFLADRAGIPRERVNRAMSESSPPDSAILTRITADLQRLLQVLH